MASNEIRKRNRESIARAFLHAQQLRSSEIAKATGLSVVTVNAVLEEMVIDGEVTRSGVTKRTGGRPSVQYALNRSYRCGVVIFAHNKGHSIALQYVVANNLGEILLRGGAEHDHIDRTHVIDLLDRAKGHFPAISQLVLGFPGFANERAVSGSDYSRFMDAAFLEEVSAAYQLSTTFVNDVNAAVYGYHAGSESARNEACIFFPRMFPPGVGIMVGGRIYSGTTGFAGEIGQLPVPIPWSELHLCDREQIAAQIAPTLMSVTCLLNPRSIVVYCDYIDSAVLWAAEGIVSGYLPRTHIPHIEWSGDFDRDMRSGLIMILTDKLRYTADRP